VVIVLQWIRTELPTLIPGVESVLGGRSSYLAKLKTTASQGDNPREDDLGYSVEISKLGVHTISFSFDSCFSS
jgi:hypothetical protein